jgi:hypothetical protein
VPLDRAERDRRRRADLARGREQVEQTLTGRAAVIVTACRLAVPRALAAIRTGNVREAERVLVELSEDLDTTGPDRRQA